MAVPKCRECEYCQWLGDMTYRCFHPEKGILLIVNNTSDATSPKWCPKRKEGAKDE